MSADWNYAVMNGEGSMLGVRSEAEGRQIVAQYDGTVTLWRMPTRAWEPVPCGFTFPTPGGLAAECDLPLPCPVHVTGGSIPNPTEASAANAPSSSLGNSGDAEL